MVPIRRLRLFHFDIKTYRNYGDTLLFEAVREVFSGFAGGAAFEVYDGWPLRLPTSQALIDYINETADAVVVGGGGLFLSDTNRNQRSGWQWDISLDHLRQIDKPLIVFGVGNNRFIGQKDFRKPFREHLNLTLDKSVFFGLRNNGSIETIRQYVDGDTDRVVYQPCPTTLSSYLFPDLYRAEIANEKRLGAQSILGKRQAAAGFDAHAVYQAQANVLERLVGEGWHVNGLPHARADMRFHQLLQERGILGSETLLWGDDEVLFRGVERFADLPVMLGTRGHAQMVPFGMGSVPLSLHVHDKVRYFASDIGHAEWAIDPRADDFESTLYTRINEVHERQPELRKELAEVREDFFRLTLSNLAEIYRRVAGQTVEPSFRPLTPDERPRAERVYRYGHERERLAESAYETAVQNDAFAVQHLVARAAEGEARGERARGRSLRRAAELLEDPTAPASTLARAVRRARRMAGR